MDSYWESAITAAGYNYDAGPVDIEPDWFGKFSHSIILLGIKYSPPIDSSELLQDIRSRIYCSYRKNFTPIADASGPVSDQGWGCMHRVGQMMLAHTLIMIHLGRDWRWFPDEFQSIYARIEDLFHDVRSANYSIHQITNMGMGETKEIGKWFGPNTVAQVIKKLSLYDDWTNLVVHVAMEEGIIIDELKIKCSSKQQENEQSSAASYKAGGQLDSSSSSSFFQPNNKMLWHPLLLIVPLRLGLHKTNSLYLPALKRCLELPQCVGILGGWPRHALWIIGYSDDHLLYLDPHITQPAVTVSANSLSSKNSNSGDAYPPSSLSYHTVRVGRLHSDQLDPSLAIGFVCCSSQSLEELCSELRSDVLRRAQIEPLFEIHDTRPEGLNIPTVGLDSSCDTLSFNSRDSDSDFEII